MYWCDPIPLNLIDLTVFSAHSQLDNKKFCWKKLLFWSFVSFFQSKNQNNDLFVHLYAVVWHSWSNTMEKQQQRIPFLDASQYKMTRSTRIEQFAFVAHINYALAFPHRAMHKWKIEKKIHFYSKQEAHTGSIIIRIQFEWVINVNQPTHTLSHTSTHRHRNRKKATGRHRSWGQNSAVHLESTWNWLAIRCFSRVVRKNSFKNSIIQFCFCFFTSI